MAPLADGVCLVVLAAFAVRGGRRGTLAGLAGLVVLGVAFPAAVRLGPALEGAVVKATSASGPDLRAIAWLVAFASVLAAGRILVALAEPAFRRVRPDARWERGLAHALGLVHGALGLTLAAYVLLAAFPSAERTPAVAEATEGASAGVLRTISTGLRSVLPVPGVVAERAAEVDRRLGGVQGGP